MTLALGDGTVWLRAFDDDVCPSNGEKIRSQGTRFNPRAFPCVRMGNDGKPSYICPHLKQEYSGRLNVMIRCDYKGES